MIQELLGVVEDRKFPNISGGLLGVPNEPAVASSCSPAHSTTSSSSSSAAASTTTSSSTSNGAEQQHLRCPRCDSTNTKFCYYNNYNLTQPRHFCKTCRRYWTQGGALRNVPIGGGCRKTKTTGISLGGAAKSANSCTTGIKAKPQASDLAGVINGKSAGFGGAMGFVDHELPSSPILWAAPQNSHLLSLLRAAQISSGVSNTSTTNASSNPNPNPIRNMTNIYTNPPARVVKEEGPMAAGSHLVPETSLLINALNARNLGLDPLGQQVPFGLCNSLWRSSPQYLQHPLQHQQQQPLVPGLQQQQQQQQQNNIGMLQSSDQSPSSAGIQELIQRLRSTNNVHHYTDHQAPQLVQLGNGCPASSSSSSSPAISFSTPAAAITASSTAAISEPAPVAGGEFGCWINTSSATTPFAWADMPNINGAFP